jgi:hypoxanthine phosphoribosyltransferase
LKDARTFRPSTIFGINRGGAIVGGIIAKGLPLPGLTLLMVNADLPQGLRVVEHRSSTEPLHGRALLVDDAKYKGEHMREATDYLLGTYPGLTLRRSILLEVHASRHRGPEQLTFQNVPVEKAAFYSRDVDVFLPWDPVTEK